MTDRELSPEVVELLRLAKEDYDNYQAAEAERTAQINKQKGNLDHGFTEEGQGSNF